MTALRRLCALCLLLLVLAPAPAAQAVSTTVMIGEFATRGPSAATDEFVELYNPTTAPINIGGWKLQYNPASNTGWLDRAILPANTFIPAHGFYLIANQSYLPGTPPDYTSGLWNSGTGMADNGHVRIIDGSAVEIDKVGWGTAANPEGSAAPNHGTSANGNSVERKALATSTADSLASGGNHALLGNGRDTDNNANDFVVQTHGRNPQNSANSPEPALAAGGNGTGKAAMLPSVVYANASLDSLRFLVAQDSAYTITTLAITVPSAWTWSHSAGSVVLTGSAFSGATPTVTADTIFVTGATLTQTDSGRVVIVGLTTPATKGTSVFTVRTAIAAGTLTPIAPPGVRVLELVPIVSVHVNNSSGVPVAPFAVGSEATVTGIVTANLSDTRTDVYVQDATAGIDLFHSSLAPITLAPGDSITVTGTILQFRGLTEIQPDFSLLVRHATGRPVPAPQVMTCANVNATFHADFTEPDEGRLVRVNNVTYNPGGVPFATITDGSGTANIFVPNTWTGVPTQFSVIGILKQFKPGTPAPGPPYTADYEIAPRTQADIIALGPNFLSTPYEDTIQPTSVVIHWTTDVASSSLVRFGTTSAYGDSVADANLVTTHAVTLTGLTAATVYHFSAGSADGNGATFAPDQLFSTASPAQSSGQMNVYFNKSVDAAIAWLHAANGDQDLVARLITRLDTAKRSIDAALYSLSGTPGANLATALINAKNRGVKVRVVCEDDNRNTTAFNSLASAGITIVTDTFDPVNGGAGLMHNKFFVIDGRGGAPESTWVWSGSWNPTDPGTNNDFQNSIEIQDQALAVTYTLEFEEMWGSSSETPNASNSRFGAHKADNTPHHFVIGGRAVESYFSPSDQVTSHIISTIDAAQHSIGFQLLTMTMDPIAVALIAQKNAGIVIHGDLDNNTDTGSEYATLVGAGIDVGLKTGAPGLLHHKYCIVDAESPYWDAVTLTGSHNWSSAAENSNNENTLIIHSFDIANQYEQEFRARYHQFGGSDPINVGVDPVAAAPRALMLAPTRPNPARDQATVAYAIPAAGRVSLKLFDVQGRVRMTLVDGDQPAGNYRLRVPTSQLPSGVYFLRLQAGAAVQQRKLMHLE